MVVVLIGRRGLGPVLTMALVILGVMIGVVLLWIFAQKSIDRGEDIIDPDCFTIDLELESCKAYGSCSYYSGGSGYGADILIKRGIGRADLTGLRFSFEDTVGKKGVYDFDLTTVQLEELQSVQFTDPVPARIPVVSSEPHLVRAVALVGANRDVCPIPSQPVFCSIQQPTPSLGAVPGANNIVDYCCKCAPNLNYSACYPGNDTLNYPIINGLVHNITDPGPPIQYAPYPQGVPPGYSSVCCSQTPGGLINDPLPSYFNDPSNPLWNINLQNYWTSNSGVYGAQCPSYTGPPVGGT